MDNKLEDPKWIHLKTCPNGWKGLRSGKACRSLQVSSKCIKSRRKSMGNLIKVKSIHSYLFQWSSLRSQMRYSTWRKELPIKNQSFWSRFRIWRGQKSHHKFRTSIRAFMGFHICPGRSLIRLTLLADVPYRSLWMNPLSGDRCPLQCFSRRRLPFSPRIDS